MERRNANEGLRKAAVSFGNDTVLRAVLQKLLVLGVVVRVKENLQMFVNVSIDT